MRKGLSSMVGVKRQRLLPKRVEGVIPAPDGMRINALDAVVFSFSQAANAKRETVHDQYGTVRTGS